MLDRLDELAALRLIRAELARRAEPAPPRPPTAYRRAPTSNELIAQITLDPLAVRHIHSATLTDLRHVLTMRQQDPEPDACRSLLIAVIVLKARAAADEQRRDRPFRHLIREAEQLALTLGLDPPPDWFSRVSTTRLHLHVGAACCLTANATAGAPLGAQNNPFGRAGKPEGEADNQCRNAALISDEDGKRKKDDPRGTNRSDAGDMRRLKTMVVILPSFQSLTVRLTRTPRPCAA